MAQKNNYIFFNRLGIYTLCYFFMHCHATYAAAWNQEKGAHQLILNTSYYTSNKSFTKSGAEASSARFNKFELNPYYEYGATSDITVGMNTFLQHVRQKVDTIPKQQTRLTSIELFARKQLYRKGNWAVAVQPLIKIPGAYDENNQPNLGEKQISTELRFLAGYSFKAALPSLPFSSNVKKTPHSHFINVEAAVRHHAEQGKDEIRIDPTLGIRTSEATLFMLQGFSTFGVGPAGNAALQGGNPFNYDLIKVQGSVVKTITPKTSIQLGAFQDIWGRNIGKGSGGLLSLWYQF